MIIKLTQNDIENAIKSKYGSTSMGVIESITFETSRKPLQVLAELTLATPEVKSIPKDPVGVNITADPVVDVSPNCEPEESLPDSEGSQTVSKKKLFGN